MGTDGELYEDVRNLDSSYIFLRLADFGGVRFLICISVEYRDRLLVERPIPGDAGDFDLDFVRTFVRTLARDCVARNLVRNLCFRLRRATIGVIDLYLPMNILSIIH